MNKNKGFSGVLKGGFSLFTTLALVLNIASPAVVLASGNPHTAVTVQLSTINGLPSTNTFSCAENPLFNPVIINGTGSLGNNPQGSKDSYKIQIDWGDASTTSGIIPTYNSDPNTDNNFTFSAEPHIYASTTSVSIHVRLYHSQPPGADPNSDSFVVVPVCVHVPPPTYGSLTLTKVVDNTGGGTKQVSDFPLFVGPTTTVISGQVNDFLDGAYAIRETNATGYTGTFSGDCDIDGHITIIAGQHFDCTLTNTYGTTTSTSTNSAPTITLNGSNPMDITVGTIFTDPGATASDTEDGNLTSHIVTTGSVDASTTGTYILTYTVTDSGGLSASTTRTVNVNPVSPQQVQLTVSTSGEGTGTVKSDDGKINCTTGSEDGCSATYDEGATTTLTATASDGSTFSDTWTGACTGNNPVCPITMNGAQSVNAHFSLSSTTTTTTTTTTTGGGGGSSIPGGHRHSGGSTGGQVLGISIGPDGFLECSDPYLTEYLHIGNKNNPEQVKKLQQFLNEYLQIDLPVTGTFGQMTYDAVMKFQAMNEAAILAPWGNAGLPTGPTGYVYKTTQRWINILKCPTLITTTPIPTLP